MQNSTTLHDGDAYVYSFVTVTARKTDRKASGFIAQVFYTHGIFDESVFFYSYLQLVHIRFNRIQEALRKRKKERNI